MTFLVFCGEQVLKRVTQLPSKSHLNFLRILRDEPV